MAEWTIEPSIKKSLIEYTHYTKDGNTIINEVGWRWGEFTCTTENDEPPNIVEGDDLYCCDYEVELVCCTDGCWEDNNLDDCDDETKEWLEAFLEENSVWELEEHGWSLSDGEMIIACTPVITRKDQS